MTLGERIYHLRTQAGLSQEELAEKTGVSRQSVSKWETDASTPELEKLIQLAKIFGITLDALVQDAPQEPAKPEKPTMETVPHTSGFFTPARIVGLILFTSALLGGLLSLIFPSDLTGFVLFLCGYLLICGLICITVRKNPGFAIGAATLICVMLILLAFSSLAVKRVAHGEEYIESAIAGTLQPDP